MFVIKFKNAILNDKIQFWPRTTTLYHIYLITRYNYYSAKLERQTNLENEQKFWRNTNSRLSFENENNFRTKFWVDQNF